jgi:D-sedoheptulose 7-phosphate isomerase
MRDTIIRQLHESAEVKRRVAQSQLPQIESAANALIACYRAGGKAIFFGNGGSAADAQHLAGELLGRFLRNRRAVPALALSANSSTVTAIGNDFGYDRTFARQMEAWVESRDVAVGISTSGNSPNVLEAVRVARERGATAVGLTGNDGGKMVAACDICIVVPSNATPRIQEAHISIGHILCDLVEQTLDETVLKP